MIFLPVLLATALRKVRIGTPASSEPVEIAACSSSSGALRDEFGAVDDKAIARNTSAKRFICHSSLRIRILDRVESKPVAEYCCVAPRHRWQSTAYRPMRRQSRNKWPKQTRAYAGRRCLRTNKVPGPRRKNPNR